ncbi:MAG: sugar ABC transporter substrate-binding protein [Chloroflexota bacterium]|nr:MAG: sugar ABC transporter substrate-binding protein [Chloroflexota bacterium]
MKQRILFTLLAALLLMVVAPLSAQEPVELRITWYDDGNEGAVLRDLLDRFEAENPDIKVVIDTVAYTVILEQLPLQIQAGEGPDMARITNFPGLVGEYLDMRPYLPDAEYWETSFPAIVLQAMRAEDDTAGIYGYPTQFTVTGPFINRTLFEQANIDVPSDSGEPVSWEEWTAVARQVAEATETPYAIAMDRTGHRFAGPAMSMGATYFDADGSITIDSPGFRAMAEILFGWHTDGITPAEVWLGSGGSYAAAADFFINGQLVLYMSGSWQVGRFSNDIADAFDWEVIPNPTGPGGSTGMPGGAALMAIGSTKHPEEVARVMDWLVQEEQMREFTARTLFIPGHLGLGEVAYDTDLPAAQQALNAFAAEVPKLQEQAYQLNFHPQNFVVFNETRDRLSQVMLDELTLDEAIERIQQAVDDAVAAAQQ